MLALSSLVLLGLYAAAHEMCRLFLFESRGGGEEDSIGREGLTCQEVEDFFEKAIMQGQMNDDENDFESSCINY
jgi:hypothetical protein